MVMEMRKEMVEKVGEERNDEGREKENKMIRNRERESDDKHCRRNDEKKRNNKGMMEKSEETRNILEKKG